MLVYRVLVEFRYPTLAVHCRRDLDVRSLPLTAADIYMLGSHSLVIPQMFGFERRMPAIFKPPTVESWQ